MKYLQNVFFFLTIPLMYWLATSIFKDNLDENSKKINKLH